MSNGDQKTVDKDAKGVIDKDVEKQGEGGRPGKKGGQTALRKMAVPALAGLLLIAAATTVYYTMGNSGNVGPSGPATSGTPTPGTPVGTASPPAAANVIDGCLVGAWRSESLVSEVGYKGGAGIVLTIKPDGAETIDYNGMKPIEGGGETHLWGGIVEAYFTTSKGTATVTKAGKTDLTVKETYRDGRVSERNTKALGPAALGNYPTDRSYTCDGTTLKFKGVLYTSTFKREKK